MPQKLTQVPETADAGQRAKITGVKEARQEKLPCSFVSCCCCPLLITVIGRLQMLSLCPVSEVTQARVVQVAPAAGMLQGQGPTKTWLEAALALNPTPAMQIVVPPRTLPRGKTTVLGLVETLKSCRGSARIVVASSKKAMKTPIFMQNLQIDQNQVVLIKRSCSQLGFQRESGLFFQGLSFSYETNHFVIMLIYLVQHLQLRQRYNKLLIILFTSCVMKDQDFIGSESEEEIPQKSTVNAMLPPANPIISKNFTSINQRVSIKIDNSPLSLEDSNSTKFRNNMIEKQISAPIQQKEKQFKHLAKKNRSQNDQGTLTDQYDSKNLVYKRYDNEKFNKRGSNKYIASIFFAIQSAKSFKIPEYKGVFQDDHLQFGSNFQSANLLAVYKKGQKNYDLLLQNDINSVGFTQWYNFKVHNKKNNFIAQFNIVNFYKSHSLYSQGMKPCVLSERSCKNNKRVWRRKGFNIYYEQNSLCYEDNQNKCYKTLSFQYDFTIQNDSVQFAHAMPYDLERLKSTLQSLKNNNKVTIKTIGTTLMGIPIPMLKLKSLEKAQSIQKKALVLLARQHPGQTVGSFIAEEMLLQLLRHSTQVDFLLFRFDIYIFPMVNLDGVTVGNYRSNFAGFDLNRCWLKTDPLKHPQVFAIKTQIKKIKKKQNIELILDLHGHSRKMGSFFYGNTFGINPMLFPFIASKINTNISFQDSKFSIEKASKASTARVVLGNLIRQTGNVYTYEVSFFGNYKNDRNKTFSFNEEHYQELGKALVLAMYRTYMETYKEQKTLKESIYLKSIKKEIQIYKETIVQKNDEDSGSDSQAQNAMIEQVKELQNYQKHQKESIEHEDVEEFLDETVLVRVRDKKQQKLPIQKRNDEIRNKINDLLDRSANTGQYLQIKGLVRSRLPFIENKKNELKEQELQRQLRTLQEPKSPPIRKTKNPHKLKVYGQTYQLKSRMIKEEIQAKQQKGYLQRQISSLKKNIGMKRQLSKQYIREQDHQLSRSSNTINVIQKNNKNNSSNFYLGEIRKIKNRNNPLQVNEINPFFSQQLVSDSIKVQKLSNSKINNSSLLFENGGRGIKLPQI